MACAYPVRTVAVEELDSTQLQAFQNQAEILQDISIKQGELLTSEGGDIPLVNLFAEN